MLLFSDEELKAKYTLLVPLTSQKQLQEIDFNSCALAMLPPNGSRLCLHSLKHICLLHFSFQSRQSPNKHNLQNLGHMVVDRNNFKKLVQDQVQKAITTKAYKDKATQDAKVLPRS